MATCRGIDVSAYQSAQNWGALAAGGVAFAMAKASEGQRSRDGRFAAHITGIKAAGLVPGAYHFGWPNQDVAAEAGNYIGAVRPYAGTGFTHWLDLERYSDGRNYAGRTAAQIRAWAAAWVAAVRAAFPGQRVGVYTSAADLSSGHYPAGSDALWYPAYPGTSVDTYAEAATQSRPSPSGFSPLFWQFTSRSADQPRGVDESICYLPAAGLRAWAAGTTIEEGPMAGITKQDIHDATWKIDDITAGSTEKNPDNKTWQPQTYLKLTFENTVKLLTAEAAQTAAITALAALVGSGVDTAAVVAAVQQAIADAVVKVSVDVSGTNAP